MSSVQQPDGAQPERQEPEQVTDRAGPQLRKSCEYCVRMKRACDGDTPCELCLRRNKQCIRSVKKRSGPAKGAKYCKRRNRKPSKAAAGPSRPAGGTFAGSHPPPPSTPSASPKKATTDAATCRGSPAAPVAAALGASCAGGTRRPLSDCEPSDKEKRGASQGTTFEVLNPATEQVVSVCANAGEDDVDKAVKAARACFEGSSWGVNSTGAYRGACLRALASAIEADKDAFALAETGDTGKPIEDSEGEVGEAVEYLRFYAGLAEALDAEGPNKLKTPTYNKNFRTRVVREPLGVVAAITPWNYPLCTAVVKVAAALAAGCTVVLKPSELAPSTCLRLARLAEAAGLPPGALNVITGEGFPTGDALSRHPGVDKISFTGSVPTGKRVMEAAAKAGPTDVHLELGGKSAMIVFEDVADIRATVDWICVGIFSNSGQVCSATSRLLVQSSIYEEVVSAVIDQARRISIGDPLRRGEDAPGPCMGPLISRSQKERVLGFVSRAVEGGASALFGGATPPDDDAEASGRKPGVGYYVSPTILSGLSDGDEAWESEIFGPVLCVRRFEEEREAVEAANRSEFGLAAAVMSSDKERCKRVAKALRAGVVWENCSQCSPVEAPWGGFKRSGVGGRELGRWGLDEFLGVKAITSCKGSFSYNSYNWGS